MKARWIVIPALVLAVGACGSSDGEQGVSASSASNGGAGTEVAAKEWPSAWCDVQPGMSREEVEGLMGEPTSVDEDGTMSWSWRNYLLIAFLDANDKVSSLLNNNDGIIMTAEESASFHCEANRTAR